jgi:D-glycero-alpha-D-manno-heptose-7-phosphate kinase
MIVEASAPTRIDLAGGTLDIWPLYMLVDGAVTVNAAIDLYARCSLRGTGGRAIRLASRDGGVSASFRSARGLGPRRGLELIVELVRFFSPATGFHLQTECAAPAGSGLGGSSALAVALTGALMRFTGQRHSRADIIDICRDLEARVIRASTGTQDYLGAMHGGWNAVWYGPGRPRVERLEVPAGTLEPHMMLYYTGRSRASAKSNRDMLRRCLEGKRGALTALEGIAAAARGMREALRAGDPEAAGACLRQEWRWRRRLSPEIGRGGVEPLIRRAIRAGALGAKPCGAGGGGCVLVLCEEIRQNRLEEALRGSGARRLPFRVVRRGLRVNNLDAGRAVPV